MAQGLSKFTQISVTEISVFQVVIEHHICLKNKLVLKKFPTNPNGHIEGSKGPEMDQFQSEKCHYFH